MFIPWFKLKLTALLKKIEPKARTLFEFGLPTAKKTLGGKAGRRPGTHLKSRPSKIILVPLLVLLLIFSTGCWDKREIEDLAFLTAWGLDRLENDEIQASVVIVKPFAVAGPAGGGAVARERPFWLAKYRPDLLEAMCNLPPFRHDLFSVLIAVLSFSAKKPLAKESKKCWIFLSATGNPALQPIFLLPKG